MKMMFSYFFVVSILCSTVFAQPPKHCALDDDDSSHDYLDIREETRSSALTDSNLTLVGEWPWGPCYAVAVRDSYALIGNGKLIQVMDISDPSNPTVAAEYNTGGLVMDIQLRDTLAFVCKGGGLQILNISNLFSPQEISFLSLIAAREVIPTDSFAYVLENPGYNPLIKVIDINDPSNPFIRSSTPTAADFVVHMAVRNRTIYATGSNLPFLTIVDASNPDSLVHHDAMLISRSICIRDTLMYLAVTSSLTTYSIADPFNPVFLGEKFCGVYSNLSGVEVSVDYAYASNDTGLFVFNVADPYNISVEANYITTKGTILIYNAGLIHIASKTGYDIVNVSNVDSIYGEGKFYTGGTPNDIAIQGHYAYVATGRPGLTILDLTNPIVPVRVGVLDFGKESYSIAVKDSFAYIGADGFWTIDISNPQALRITSFLPSVIFSKDFQWIRQIIINDNRVYTLDSAVTIYDIQVPSSPTKIGFHAITYLSFQLALKDSLLFVVSEDAWSNIVIVLNVSNPPNVFEVSRMLYNSQNIIIRDSNAFIAVSNGLMIVNISNPTIPESLSFIGAPVGGIDISPTGKYIYMSSYKNTMTIDVSDLRNPLPAGIVEWIGSDNIISYGSYLFICQDYWITILKNDLIASVNTDRSIPNENQLLQNYPNPFNPRTNISFELSHSFSVSLKIYNLLGNEISTLLNEQKPAGIYTIELNAEGLPSGIYYYRLQTGKYFETKKMLLIR